jgi:hypothetical protein
MGRFGYIVMPLPIMGTSGHGSELANRVRMEEKW